MVGSFCSPESSELQSDEPVSFFRGLKLVMNHGAYIKLITGFLFTSLAFMVRRAGLEDEQGQTGAWWARISDLEQSGDVDGEWTLVSVRSAQGVLP